MSTYLFFWSYLYLSWYKSIFLINVGMTAIFQKPGQHEQFQPVKSSLAAIYQLVLVSVGQLLSSLDFQQIDGYIHCI